MTQDQRDKRARTLEHGANVTAATVGTGLGASKLRDAYAKEHPHSFATGERGVARISGTKLARTLAHGEPGFKPLLAGTITGVGAAAAKKHRQKRETQLLTKSAFGVPHELAKGNDTNPIAVVDNKVRDLRGKVVPTKTKLVVIASNTTAKVKDKLQQDMAKAYGSPQQAHRRRARAGEVAAVGGASAFGVAGHRDARASSHQAHLTQASEKAAGSDFHLARRAAGTVAEHHAAYSRTPGTPGGRARNTANLGETFGHHQREWRHVEAGTKHIGQAYDHALGAAKLARSAKNKTAVAAGLSAVALGAHRSARKPKKR